MVKGGVLQVALIISFIIASILLSLILLIYSQRLIFIKSNIERQLIRNSHSGINYLLANRTNRNIYSESFDLFGDSFDTVNLSSRQWGLYDLISSTAKKGSNFHRKIAMVGTRMDSLGEASLYLIDNSKPLAVAGNTLIKGNVYVPKAGVKRAYFNGRDYEADKLVFGEIYYSKNFLPKLKGDLTLRLRDLQNSSDSYLEQYCVEVANIPLVEFSNSFGQKTVFVNTGSEKLYLKNLNYDGNIILWNSKEIIVENSAKLNNVILVAPKLNIKSGFKGRLQLFSSDTIIIESNCQFYYPSAICIGNKIGESLIEINNNCRFYGDIVQANDPNVRANNGISKLAIGPESIIAGSVYADNVSLQGEIWGNIICSKFYYYSSSGLYENYLLDAKIDIKKRSNYYLTSPLISTSGKDDIIQWVK